MHTFLISFKLYLNWLQIGTYSQLIPYCLHYVTLLFCNKFNVLIQFLTLCLDTRTINCQLFPYQLIILTQMWMTSFHLNFQLCYNLIVVRVRVMPNNRFFRSASDIVGFNSLCAISKPPILNLFNFEFVSSKY